MKVIKRGLPLLLAAMLTVTVIPMSGMTAAAADTSKKNIELGTGGIVDWDFVYFGNYTTHNYIDKNTTEEKNEDIKWKVLDADADNTGDKSGMVLLSEYLLERNTDIAQFDADNRSNSGQSAPNQWQGSDAQVWCKKFAKGDSSAFTKGEQSALKSVNKSDKEGQWCDEPCGKSELRSESVFYLSQEEVDDYYNLVNSNDERVLAKTSGGTSGGYYLRSPKEGLNEQVGYIYGTPNPWVNFYYVNGTTHPLTRGERHSGIRPAFNLNRNSILFTSAATGGKSSGTVGPAALESVSDYTSGTAREWKTTIKDSAHTGFYANAVSGAITTKDAGYNNWSVDITYGGAKTGSDEYVSAVLCDKDDKVLYYGNIAQNNTSGTATVDVPKGLAAGDYTLKVFSEQKNADYKTDYASEFSSISLTVNKVWLSKPDAGFTATSENGGTLTKIESGMSYSVNAGTDWIALTGDTATITGVTAEHDIQVKRIGDGTSIFDSDVQTIEVTQAEKPTGLSGTACTSLEQNDGKISGVNDTMEYKLSSESNWQSVTGTELTGLSNGTYQVRVKADGTILASPTSDVTVGEHTCTPSGGGWLFDDSNHWKVCTCGANVDVAAHSGGTATCKDAAVCEICGHAYGTRNPANHSGLEKIEAKAATHLETGNITYWHCSGCDKYYSDEAAQNEISAKDTVLEKREGHTPDGTGWHSDENGHWNTCACGEKIDVAAHSGGVATCKDAAVCEVCGHAYGTTNPANHSGLEKIEAKAATHLATGNMTYWHCKGCDKYYSDEAAQNEISAKDIVLEKRKGHTPDGTGWHSDESGHWNTCACGEKLNKASHIFEWKIDKEAQVGVAGSKHEECTVCGYKKATVEIPALIAPEYPPIVEDTKGVKITVSPENPQAGDEVTITTEPENRKKVDKVIITDENGKEISVIDNGDGTYTFTQPEGKVTIKVTFKTIKETFKTEENKTSTDEKSPQTGDNSNLCLWFALIFVSGGGIITTIVYGRKKKHSIK